MTYVFREYLHLFCHGGRKKRDIHNTDDYAIRKSEVAV